MSRVLLRLAQSPDAPVLTRSHVTVLVSPFGRWLRSQLIVTARRWPAVALHRLSFAAAEVRLTLVLRHPMPPLVAGLVMAHALQRETTAAARAMGWLESGAGLWRAGGTVVVAVTDRPERRDGLARRPFGEARPRIPFASLRVTQIR